MIYLELSLIFLLGTAVTIIVFMAIYLKIRRNRRTKYAKWNNMADLLLRKAIFFEGDTDQPNCRVPVTGRVTKLLLNDRFRSHLTKKIISAARSLSGQSSDNLRSVYLQLELDKFALKMIGSNEWHKKAYGIQQLGVMGLKSHLDTVYRYTSHSNELIRIEAQLSVLKLHGFEGLRFLDAATYRISEWQQILLLKELSLHSHSNLTGIDKWLQSANSSVVIFALKLTRNYHHYELYDAITHCVKHPDAGVRMQAIYALTEIYTEGTSALLLDLLPGEQIDLQLPIARALRKIGDRNDLPALISFLEETPNLTLKLELTRSIAHIDSGVQTLQETNCANTYPMNEIIAQIKSEIR